MLYSTKITGAEKGSVIKDGSLYLDVSFNILKDGEVVTERRLAFPMETTKAEVLAELEKYCVMFETDHASVAMAEAEQMIRSQADEVIADLMSDKE